MADHTRRRMVTSSLAALGVVALGRTDTFEAVAQENSRSEPRGDDIPIYVALNGNDHWSGRMSAPSADNTDGPLATLIRARDVVREIRTTDSLRRRVTVMIRQGKYYLEEPLVLGPEDSGSPNALISYRAYPGETVTLSGGYRVANWEPYKGKIIKAELPGLKGGRWKSRQLFFNNKRQTRARWPKYDPANPLYGGWAYMEGPAREKSAIAFRYKPGAVRHRWAKPGVGEINLFPGVGSGWYNDIIPIKHVDETTRAITLTREFLQLDREPWYLPEGFRPENRFVVENLLEELDQPGEWCLDSEDGILYFWPPQDITSDEIVIPRLHCLIQLKHASFVDISKLTFTETADGDDTHRDGLEGYGPMFPHQGWQYCGEAVHLEDAERCSIHHNRFYAVGGNGIYLSAHNLRNVIRHNEISWCGANGIALVGTRNRNPMFNMIEDNEIHHCGIINKYVAGVFLGLSEMNVVGHNFLHHLPHHAINLGNRGYGRNFVENNEIRHVCTELFDTGAINSWMEDPGGDMEPIAERSGHVIRHNLIADVGPSTEEFLRNDKSAPDRRTGIRGIYLDTNSSNCFVYGNIMIRAGGWGFHLQNGRNNVLENNVIVDSDNAIIYADYVSWFAPQMDGYMSGNRFYRNIFYSNMSATHHPLSGGPNSMNSLIQLYRFRDKTIQQSDSNLFFRVPGSAGTYDVAVHPSPIDNAYITALPIDKSSGLKRFTFEKWQDMGFDEKTVRIDPLFVSPEQDDYGLKPKSPAFELGFEPIDVAGIGIRHDDK
jgi:parallel beta-helix repeat protein